MTKVKGPTLNAKVLDKFSLIPIILPLILLALILSMLPDYLIWILVMAVFAHLIISIIRLFKK